MDKVPDSLGSGDARTVIRDVLEPIFEEFRQICESVTSVDVDVELDVELLKAVKRAKELMNIVPYILRPINKLIPESEAELIDNLEQIEDINEQLGQAIQHKEARLLQSRRMATLGVMASGMAHEINQPLQIILSVAQNSIREIRQNTIDNDGILRDLAQIAANTKRIDEIVNHLQVIARERKPKMEMVDINIVIKNSFIMFHQQLTKSRGIEIKQDLSPNLPSVKADAIQLEQVFINLINNARDALDGRKSKTIQISTQNQNEHIQVRFQDNGKGVSPEDLPKIFDVFFTTKEEGMGLGLYIARDIIQSYDGTITARSKIDEGTTFLIELPVAVKEDAE